MLLGFGLERWLMILNSENGEPLFKWDEYVSRYEIKSFFGRKQQEKKKKIAKNKA